MADYVSLVNYHKVFDRILGAQATGGLEIQGRRDTVPMQFWDGEKIIAEGGVYNAKKIDMMSDQILESYDV